MKKIILILVSILVVTAKVNGQLIYQKYYYDLNVPLTSNSQDICPWDNTVVYGRKKGNKFILIKPNGNNNFSYSYNIGNLLAVDAYSYSSGNNLHEGVVSGFSPFRLIETDKNGLAPKEINRTRISNFLYHTIH